MKNHSSAILSKNRSLNGSSAVREKWLFPKDLSDAKKAQQEMAEQVLTCDLLPQKVSLIGGVDVSHTRFDPLQKVFGSIVLLSLPSLKVEEKRGKMKRETFPYIPGFLGFREIPTLLGAYEQLEKKPDLIMVDGHGISHPRGLGIASHLGVLLDLPTIGVAKSILVGAPSVPLAEEAGSMVPLKWRGKELGMCLRTKKRCLPLIVSTGHKISLPTAVKWVLDCLRAYRLPEPTRQAHLAANLFRKEMQEIRI